MARATKADLASFTRNVESRLENQDRKTENLVQEYKEKLDLLNARIEQLTKLNGPEVKKD